MIKLTKLPQQGLFGMMCSHCRQPATHRLFLFNVRAATLVTLEFCKVCLERTAEVLDGPKRKRTVKKLVG